MAEEKKAKKLHYAYVIAAAMFCMYIISTFMYGTDPLLVAPVMAELGCSNFEWGMTTTIWMLVAGFVLPFVGKLYEKVDGRWMELAAVILTAIYCAIRALAPNIYFFWFGAVLVGFAFPMVLNLMLPTFTTRWFVVKVGLVMSICSLAQGLSNSVFNTVGAVIIQANGWRFFMWVQFALTLVIGIPVALLFRSRPSDMGLKPLGYKAAAEETSTATAEIAPAAGVTKKAAMKTPSFWFMAAAVSCQMLACTYGYFSRHLQTEGIEYTLVMCGVVASALSIGQSIGKASLGTLSDIIGAKRVVFLSLACQLLGDLGVGYLAGKAPFAVICFCAGMRGVAMASANLVCPLVAKEIFGLKEFSSIWASIAQFMVILGAFYSTLWGAVADLTGSYLVSITGGAILVAAAIVFFTLAILNSKKVKAQWTTD